MARVRFLLVLLALTLGFHARPALGGTIFDWAVTTASNDSPPNFLLGGMIDFSTVADGNAFDLVITLTNTGDAPTTTAAILTGLYFDISSGVPQGGLGMS